MPDEPNIFEISTWEREYGPVRGSRLGPAAGASELGCTLYELEPGAQAVPYHLHHGNEELLIVLAMRGQGDGWAWAAGADGDYMELTRAALEADPG